MSRGACRVVAVSPGARASGVASFSVEDGRVALRTFAVIGHRDPDVAARTTRLRSALDDLLARETPTVVVVEEVVRKRRTAGVLAAREAATAAAEGAAIPVRPVPLRDARRSVCGSLRPPSLRTAGTVLAWMFPRVRALVPPKRAVRRGHWERAWVAAVLGVAAIGERSTEMSAAL